MTIVQCKLIETKATFPQMLGCAQIKTHIQRKCYRVKRFINSRKTTRITIGPSGMEIQKHQSFGQVSLKRYVLIWFFSMKVISSWNCICTLIKKEAYVLCQGIKHLPFYSTMKHILLDELNSNGRWSFECFLKKYLGNI